MNKVINPKLIWFLVFVPFMLACPLTLVGVLTGFPFDNWSNNERLANFKTAVLKYELPKNVEQIGDTVVSLGVYKERDEYDPQTCDLLGAFVVKTAIPEDALSKVLLTNFSTTYASKDDFKDFELISGADIKLFPVDLSSEFYDNGEIVLSFIKDFGFNPQTIELTEEESVYIVYIINYTAFETRDYRCRVN